MSNGARHGLGVLIGVVVTPIIAVCLMYGTMKLGRLTRTLDLAGSDRWVGGAVLLVAAVLIGLVAGSRVSPLASLVPGFVFGVAGVLWLAAPRWTLTNTGRDLLPRDLWFGYTLLGPYGIFLVLGIGLTVASVAPSRWKARTAAGAAPRFGGPPPAPMGPPPMHGAQAPMGAHHAPQGPPAPGQNPPWQGGAPQYGQPPAQPGASNPPPMPAAPPASPPADDQPRSPSRSDPDEDNPGEWTQMYGGNRPT
ncbi:hypothetical protein [Actinomadura sp. 3N407]|uniref:hypothetical protein n=1 Tax=Actinomadura sp. 3N407 TaxID=3457423 RepID=UPI003FCDD8A5